MKSLNYQTLINVSYKKGGVTLRKVPMIIQLTAALFLVMFIPIAIITLYSGKQILKNGEKSIAVSTLDELKTNQLLIEKALNNVVQDVVSLGSTDVFNQVNRYQSFAELNKNYSNIQIARATLLELNQLKLRNDWIYSTFFHLHDSDYVLSTDRGITKAERYDSMDWLEAALKEKRGIRGVWYSRKLESGVNVVSYALPLNRLATNTSGVLVVNLLEKEFDNYFLNTKDSEQTFIVMDANGCIISHSDKSELLQDGLHDERLAKIYQDRETEGYFFEQVNGEDMLYTWSKSSKMNWLNIGINNVNHVLNTSYSLQKNIIILTSIVILAGIILTFILSTWLSKPIRNLVRTLHLQGNVDVQAKNEFIYLNQVFQTMQEKEDELNELIQLREQDSRKLAIHHILRGDVTEDVSNLFPHPNFIVAIVAIDQFSNYLIQYNQETRNYHRYLFNLHFDQSLANGIVSHSVYQGEGQFSIIFNLKDDSIPAFEKNIIKVKQRVEEFLQQSVTVGVSRSTQSTHALQTRVAEAREMVKCRMVKGNGHTFYSEKYPMNHEKYTYPADVERKIINFLNSSNLDGIKKELHTMNEQIRARDYISSDNILFIYNQLLGICMKELRERNINTTQIFTENIYAELVEKETLEELEKYFIHFFEKVFNFVNEPSTRADDYYQDIIDYLDQHYCEEIDFEQMAKEIGISYSYMRKIMYDATGKSLIDHIHLKRMQYAKEMLKGSNLSISEIAKQVGYSNPQSFSRLFRKMEGLAPSQYKQSKA